MKKNKLLTQILCGMLSVSLLTGCGSSTDNTTTNTKFEQIDTDLKVGMVIGAGTIDDRSFNQGTWEGVAAAVKNARYIQPKQTSEADFCLRRL